MVRFLKSIDCSYIFNYLLPYYKQNLNKIFFKKQIKYYFSLKFKTKLSKKVFLNFKYSDIKLYTFYKLSLFHIYLCDDVTL